MSKKQITIFTSLFLIISFILLPSFLLITLVSADENESLKSEESEKNEISASDARPISVYYPLFDSFGSGDDSCTDTTRLYNDNLNACSTNIVPAPRWGLSGMVYPLSSLKYNTKKGWYTITFNFGYLGPRYPRCHVGLDIYPASSRREDNLVRAIADGIVFRLSHRWGVSNTGGVDIIHQDCAGRKFIVRYGEFADYGDTIYESLGIGQKIVAGQQLGVLSQASRHVHLELHLYENNSQEYFNAGKWKALGRDSGGADACATNVAQTNMCSTTNRAAKCLLNIRNVLWEAAEQTWPDRTLGPVMNY